MHRPLVLAAASLAVIATGFGTLALASPRSAPVAAPVALAATPFKVDAVHSAVLYKVKHMNVSYSYGRFNDVSGTFLLDAEDPSASAIDVTIKTESVDSGNGDRDKHLRSQDFFSAKEFPTIGFKSSAVRKTASGAFEVDGTLSLRGQSKPITATVESTGTGPGMRGGEMAGMHTTFTIKRSDFGMSFMVGPIGDEVTMTVSLEGGR
ncbi:MAG: YceI family protein [Phycisphaerales bacterium]|nr:YceI family protein [Phycisphaerales bacterium]